MYRSVDKNVVTRGSYESNPVLLQGAMVQYLLTQRLYWLYLNVTTGHSKNLYLRDKNTNKSMELFTINIQLVVPFAVGRGPGERKRKQEMQTPPESWRNYTSSPGLWLCGCLPNDNLLSGIFIFHPSFCNKNMCKPMKTHLQTVSMSIFSGWWD